MEQIHWIKVDSDFNKVKEWWQYPGIAMMTVELGVMGIVSVDRMVSSIFRYLILDDTYWFLG